MAPRKLATTWQHRQLRRLTRRRQGCRTYPCTRREQVPGRGTMRGGSAPRRRARGNARLPRDNAATSRRRSVPRCAAEHAACDSEKGVYLCRGHGRSCERTVSRVVRRRSRRGAKAKQADSFFWRERWTNEIVTYACLHLGQALGPCHARATRQTRGTALAAARLFHLSSLSRGVRSLLSRS